MRSCRAVPGTERGPGGLWLALLLCLLALLPARGHAACADTRVDLRGAWGNARFTVEIADDDASRAQGLMHRESMPRWSGMLFVFDGPGRRSFWMANTLIELDMLFITPEGVVAHVHDRAIPHDRTPISGGDGIQYVLEINGGLAAQLGIASGSEMRHPRLDQTIAAWPCD